MAFLTKWLWGFSTKRGNLWHSTILSKYGCHSNGWDVNLQNSRSTSQLWKNVIDLFPSFVLHVRFSVGNGTSIRFWRDLWWGEQSLSLSFRSLFCLLIYKEAKVSDVISSSPSSLSWNIQFSHDLYDWEVDMVGDLMSLLKEVFLSQSFLDQRIWTLESSGKFSSKSLFLHFS